MRGRRLKGDYGSLNVIGPYKLIGDGSPERFGLVEVGKVLLEEVCYCAGGF